MNNIIEVTKNRDSIMASQSIYCPVCGSKQYSPFDKIYTKTYECCVDCEKEEVLLNNSENIFRIIEA